MASRLKVQSDRKGQRGGFKADDRFSAIDVEDGLATMIQKLAKFADELSDKGLWLFALIKRANSIGNWDVVVAGRSIDKASGLKKISEEVSKRLSKDEVIQVSQVVILERRDLFFVAMENRMRGLPKGAVEFSGTISGIDVDQGLVLFSRVQV